MEVGKESPQPSAELAPGNRRALSIPEFCRAIGISRSSAYLLVNAGTLRTIRLGGRRLVPVSEIDRLLEGGSANNGSICTPSGVPK